MLHVIKTELTFRMCVAKATGLCMPGSSFQLCQSDEPTSSLMGSSQGEVERGQKCEITGVSSTWKGASGH